MRTAMCRSEHFTERTNGKKHTNTGRNTLSITVECIQPGFGSDGESRHAPCRCASSTAIVVLTGAKDSICDWAQIIQQQKQCNTMVVADIEVVSCLMRVGP